jgi:hypothetical protein
MAARLFLNNQTIRDTKPGRPNINSDTLLLPSRKLF